MNGNSRDISSYTVVVCGAASVGKTSLINRISKDIFMEPQKCAMAGLMTSVVVDLDDCRIRLMLWDTSANEDYRDMTVCHLAEAQACIFLYAADDQESLESIIEVWNPALESYSKVPHIPFLVGTKMDLPETERCVRIEDTEKAESLLQVSTFYVSAIDGRGVDELKEQLARQLWETFPTKERESIENVRERFKSDDSEQVTDDLSCQCLLL
jgi:small GTP-binding protein